jgi:uncharacterized RmlC-like cupin family protein
MTPITPTIRFMTPEETKTNKLINAGSILMHGSTAIPLGAGRSDHIHVFKESTVLYVLSTNNKLGYLGLDLRCFIRRGIRTDLFAVRMGA